MKALVKYGNKAGEVEIRDMPAPVIGPDEVLVRVKAAGVCGWDLEMWKHTMANPVTVPVIQGHEFCGVIEAAGANVASWKEGDRVACETSAVVCGECLQCRTGNYHLCPKRRGFGYGVDGAFTDFVKVRAQILHRLPDGIPFDHACLAEPCCVAYQSVAVLSTVVPGTPVLVIGPGPIGMFCLQMVKAMGAGPVMVAGTSRRKQRMDVAKKLGADECINVDAGNALEAVLELTGGEGAPLVIDAAGNTAAFSLAIHAVARRGQITKVGWGPKPLGISLDPLLSKAARVQGTFSHNWPTWEAVIAMVHRGTIVMEPMISHRITIAQWLETFEALDRGDGIKAVMQFNR